MTFAVQSGLGRGAGSFGVAAPRLPRRRARSHFLSPQSATISQALVDALLDLKSANQLPANAGVSQAIEYETRLLPVMAPVQGEVPMAWAPPAGMPPSSPESAWAVMESLIGSIEGPRDLAREHDFYLYGTPKKSTRS